MNQIQLEIPTKIFWGRNNIGQVLQQQKDWIKGNIMIVTTGGSLIRLGYVEQLKQMILAISDVKKVILSREISANPKVFELDKIVQQGLLEEINIVIGFGGGSSIDAAKAVAAGIGDNEKLSYFLYNGIEPSNKTLPVIAIPTTAGTGSELSKAAIVTDTDKKIKGGIRSKNLYPKIAIVDSSYTDSTPHRVTVETGFDVLAHAIESYTSRKATAFTEMLSERAIKAVGVNLPKLCLDLSNRTARDEMSYASMLMGINLGNASTCLPHRMQYPIGAYTDTSHGIGLAALFSAWISYEYIYAEEKIKRALYLLSGKNIQNKDDAVKCMEDFLERIGLNVRLHQLGIQEGQLDMLAKEVTGNIETDPASSEKQVIKNIYHMSF